MSVDRVSDLESEPQDYSDASADMVLLPLRHWGRYVTGLLAVVFGGGIAWSILKNPNLQWPVIRSYLFSGAILGGLKITLLLTIVAIAIGFIGGIILALMTLSQNPPLRLIAQLWINIERGIPILVQIIFWGYLGAFYNQILIGIPFTHITFLTFQTNQVVGSTVAAILALGFMETAYAAEIVRGGILGVDNGQKEAAASLGMTPLKSMRRVVVPQAMRTIIPPFGNELISMLKTTSLVAIIGGRDLMTNVQNIYAQTYQVIPLLAVASIWYILLTTLLTIPQRWLEARYGRGTGGAPQGLLVTGVRRMRERFRGAAEG